VGICVGVGGAGGGEVGVDVAVDCNGEAGSGSCVGVNVGGKELLVEQPLSSDNNSVSQTARIQRGKSRKRDLDMCGRLLRI